MLSDLLSGAMMEDDEFLTRKGAALYLTSIGYPVNHRTMANWAANNNAGNGPPFLVLHWSRVWYRKSDLDAWVRNRVRRVE